MIFDYFSLGKDTGRKPVTSGDKAMPAEATSCRMSQFAVVRCSKDNYQRRQIVARPC
jgi:hypothetical protein